MFLLSRSIVIFVIISPCLIAFIRISLIFWFHKYSLMHLLIFLALHHLTLTETTDKATRLLPPTWLNDVDSVIEPFLAEWASLQFQTDVSCDEEHVPVEPYLGDWAAAQLEAQAGGQVGETQAP